MFHSLLLLLVAVGIVPGLFSRIKFCFLDILGVQVLMLWIFDRLGVLRMAKLRNILRAGFLVDALERPEALQLDLARSMRHL